MFSLNVSFIFVDSSCVITILLLLFFMVYFFSFKLNLVMRELWSDKTYAPGYAFTDLIEFLKLSFIKM